MLVRHIRKLENRRVAEPIEHHEPLRRKRDKLASSGAVLARLYRRDRGEARRGHGKAPDAQEVEHGKKAKKPANPTADGYTFGGWYKDEACKEAYDFSAPVTEDVTLYAKWTKKSSSGTSPKTGDPLAGVFAVALALAAASALALAFSGRMRRG
ncbi:MAG: InlB B-repeat-containing protein [Eggerthellaceae bacterium]|nr:InlB B-repeat-containing protein [Eggerthellaceae bacterium]